jgi:hypothetical protein
MMDREAVQQCNKQLRDRARIAESYNGLRESDLSHFTDLAVLLFDYVGSDLAYKLGEYLMEISKSKIEID